ncbi:caspase, EACC1-associated type [Streptomyces herbicida]|uniref:caspase, EACC1-associated type n=1 Tax=Streptomyces herbicida TaxID=3065675 RepID=UPI00292E2973|nr:caspase family protein [Streptomyces sp. NEAU-HV9]
MGESRHALIIANDSYQDPGLKKLRAPAQDAVALARVLGDPGIGGFEVEVVRNELAHVIWRRIDEFFSDRRPSDTLLLHFSCHGLKSESGALYFAATDTLPRLLDSTAVPAGFVRRRMASTRARSIVLFLDCCYGGAFSQGADAVRAAGDVNVLDSFAGEKLGGGRGWAVITASNSMEYAFEGTELTEGAEPGTSVFTSVVVQGLATGEADLDEDGRVSLDELYEYVFDRVRERNPHQTPSRTVDMQGDLYLARSQRRRITPSPVPEDVQAAMRSPDIYTRRGAIAELRARMENSDLSVALGARTALEEMARKDIRAVADEAGRAVNEVGVNPYPTRLDFGPVPQNSPAPRMTVRLLGPPLARSCVAHAKSDRLRVEESADGLDVRLDTAAPGELSGEIVLKGVVGEAVLHVEAEVLPASDHGDMAPAAPATDVPSPPAASASPPHAPHPSPGSTGPGANDSSSKSEMFHHTPPPPPEWYVQGQAPKPGPAAATPSPRLLDTPRTAERARLATPSAPARAHSGNPASPASPASPARSQGVPPKASVQKRYGGSAAPRGGVHPGPAPGPAPPDGSLAPPPPNRARTAPPAPPGRSHGTLSPPPPAAGVGQRHEPAFAGAGGKAQRAALRAPLLAMAGASLAVVSAFLVLEAAVDVVRRQLADSTVGLADHARAADLLSPLAVVLLTGTAAYLFGAFAGHDLADRSARYPASTTTTTKILIRTTQLLAIPAVVLGVLLGITYLILTA